MFYNIFNFVINSVITIFIIINFITTTTTIIIIIIIIIFKSNYNYNTFFIISYY